MWHKMSREELIQMIEQLEKVALDNKAIAERTITQAKEWKALYESACTDKDAANVSVQTH